jgi:hypothetical protein
LSGAGTTDAGYPDDGTLNAPGTTTGGDETVRRSETDPYRAP